MASIAVEAGKSRRQRRTQKRLKLNVFASNPDKMTDEMR